MYKKNLFTLKINFNNLFQQNKPSILFIDNINFKINL